MKKIALICTLLCATAHAGNPPLIPADLVQVKSGGQWRDGDREGFVRFSAFEKGYENVRHRIIIEWIQTPTSQEGTPSVAARLIVDDLPDVWSVGDASFVIKDGVTFINFEAVNTYIPDERNKFTLRIIELGKAELISADQGW